MADDPFSLLITEWPYPGQPGSPVTASSVRAAAIDNKTYSTALLARLDSLANSHVFELGDLVQWKRGLRHMNNPTAKRPAVVAEMLGNPVVNTYVTPDSPYFGEILDMRVGVINDDGVFHMYLVPSARFEPYVPG